MGLKENVMSLCARNGTTPHAVEVACDLSNGTISRLDKSMISADKLLRISRHFQCTMESLLTGEQPDLMPLSPLEKDVIQAFRKSKHQEAILSLLGMDEEQKKSNVSAS